MTTQLSPAPPVAHITYDTPIDVGTTTTTTTTTTSTKNKSNNTISSMTTATPRSPPNTDEMSRYEYTDDDDDLPSPTTSSSNSHIKGPNRHRINSSDIPRTYSGLYGSGGSNGDLLPFELSRNLNTDWFDNANGPGLLVLYLSIIIIFQLAIMAITPVYASFTITNIVHGVVTITYLHWIKGSPNFYEQGEMNAMTFWEQLTSKPNDAKICPRRENRRRVLLLIPTLLCYVGCHFGYYELKLSVINVIVWCWCIISKMPFMNGVRVLGYNRTVGIDDNVMGDDDDEDCCDDYENDGDVGLNLDMDTKKDR